MSRLSTSRICFDVGLKPQPVSKNLAVGLQTLQGFVKVFLTFLERQGGDVAVLFWISIVTAGQRDVSCRGSGGVDQTRLKWLPCTLFINPNNKKLRIHGQQLKCI